MYARGQMMIAVCMNFWHHLHVSDGVVGKGKPFGATRFRYYMESSTVVPHIRSPISQHQRSNLEHNTGK